MGDRTGVLIVVASLILGASILGGSMLLQSSVNEAANQLSGLRSAVANLKLAAPAAAPTQAAARPGRPDPSRRYEVETKGSPARGPESARVSVVEFSDFQCPFCGRVSPTLDQIEETYGDDVRIVFKHLPLRIHPKAPAAHAASEAAHKQGKFWEMHDLIFENQREMSEEKYVEYATQLGLDVEQFKKDVVSAEIKARLDADQKEAERLGVSGTPAFFINGKYLSGAQPFDNFKRVIDEELKKKG